MMKACFDYVVMVLTAWTVTAIMCGALRPELYRR